MAMRAVAVTTKILPSNKTKSPMELMAKTRIEFLERSWYACLPAEQKDEPFIEITM